MKLRANLVQALVKYDDVEISDGTNAGMITALDALIAGSVGNTGQSDGEETVYNNHVDMTADYTVMYPGHQETV